MIGALAGAGSVVFEVILYAAAAISPESRAFAPPSAVVAPSIAVSPSWSFFLSIAFCASDPVWAYAFELILSATLSVMTV